MAFVWEDYEKEMEKQQPGIPFGDILKELEPLKYICNVTMGNRMFESELTEGQKELLERTGITGNDIRH